MSPPTSAEAEQPTSAQIVASVDYLLYQILLRLPMKSLIRFTTVSTHWYNLITDPKFRYLRHHPKSNPALGLFLPHDDDKLSPLCDYISFSIENPSNPPFEWLQFGDATYGVSVVQSCNGLLLCRGLHPHGDFNCKNYVYNPTINRFATLPEPDEETGIRKTTYRMNLAFDPAKSPHYKVVCVEEVELLNEGLFTFYLEVYSSETGLWKVSIKLSFFGPLYFLNGVYWNGSLHWINQLTSEGVYFLVDDNRLETLPMMPVPEELDGLIYSVLWESCGHLNMVVTRPPSIMFHIYKMKRDYSEWFIKYEVDLSLLVPSFPCLIQSNLVDYEFWILCVIRGEKDEDDFVVLQIPGKAIRYNLVSKTFEELHPWFRAGGSEDPLKLGFPELYAFKHIESLCWV